MKFLRPRNASPLSETVHHQLNLYALGATAAGVGALALAQPAEGKIVYTPAHLKILVGKPVALDLNHDGTADFTFGILSGHQDARHATMGPSSSFKILFLYPPIKSNGGLGNGRLVSALSEGAHIGGKDHFATSVNIMGGVSTLSGKGPYYSGPWADDGKAVDHRYVGLKFVINGKTHYGWARFNAKLYYSNHRAEAKALITGYAYETIANKSLRAGNTKGKAGMAPASLGHLAAGTAGR
jgi:hypothetical protein